MSDETITTAAARDSFSEVVNRAAFGKERVVLTRHGKPLAAIVPIEDVEALEAIENAHDLAEVRKALEEWERDGRKTVPLEDILRRYGVKP